jgi:hypothetical protein
MQRTASSISAPLVVVMAEWLLQWWDDRSASSRDTAMPLVVKGAGGAGLQVVTATAMSPSCDSSPKPLIPLQAKATGRHSKAVVSLKPICCITPDPSHVSPIAEGSLQNGSAPRKVNTQ